MWSVLLFIALCSASLPVVDIIEGYGYPCETHLAPTTDGWRLTMHRIPFGRTKVPTKGVVLFQHGLTDCSVGVCLNPPTESLSFILADLGYDVWLGNNRGNGYSMDNINYTPDQAEFWDFSWDEMAAYDLPAQIEYVLNATKQKDLTYIGHSEGTIQAFAGISSNPDRFASKINLMIALAPVAYVGNLGSVVFQALAALDVDEIFELFGIHEFYLTSEIGKIVPDICWLDPNGCDNGLALLMGPSVNLNASRLDYYSLYEPNPTSVKNMAHWSQGVRTDRFDMFDYGATGNVQKYNQTTPPVYNLANFPQSIPLALFTGSNDYLADPTDVARLLSDLSFKPTVVNTVSYAHADFIIAPDAVKLIYPQLVALLKQYNDRST